MPQFSCKHIKSLRPRLVSIAIELVCLYEIYTLKSLYKKVCLFVLVLLLWPSQPNGVMSSSVSLHNHSFTGQAQSSKWLTSIVHIHSSACIKGSPGVRDSQKLPWDFQKSVPGSLGLPSFKDI